MIGGGRHGGDTPAQQSASRAFSHAQKGVPRLQQTANYLFERIAVARVDAIAQQRLDLSADVIEQRLGLLRGGTACPQMHVNLAGDRKNSRNGIGVARVNGSNQLVK